MAEAEEYFEKMAALDGINSLPSGILFEILERGPGTGKSPKVDDPCSVHYHGMLTDGTVFDSSVERGRPSKFAPSDVIPGWKEVLQYMSEGEKWKVYLPYKQGYGSRGAGRAIPPYSTLIFTIELVEVVLGGKTAEEGKAMLEKATGTPYDNLKYGYMYNTEKITGMQKLKSGILFQILEAGDITRKSPELADPCTVHYHGTFPDGSVFDSSVTKGRPSNFAPKDVIAGWKEVLQYMCEGEKWKVHIPYQLAYGARGAPPRIPPFSTLVFIVQILKVNSGGKAGSEGHALLEANLGKKYADIPIIEEEAPTA